MLKTSVSVIWIVELKVAVGPVLVRTRSRYSPCRPDVSVTVEGVIVTVTVDTEPQVSSLQHGEIRISHVFYQKLTLTSASGATITVKESDTYLANAVPTKYSSIGKVLKKRMARIFNLRKVNGRCRKTKDWGGKIARQCNCCGVEATTSDE